MKYNPPTKLPTTCTTIAGHSQDLRAIRDAAFGGFRDCLSLNKLGMLARGWQTVLSTPSMHMMRLFEKRQLL